MSASNTDKLRLASSGTTPIVTSLSLPKANGATSAVLTAAAGWGTTTGCDIVLYRRVLNTTTGLYEKVDGTQTTWVGVLAGTTLSSMVLRSGTEPAAGYAADGNTVVFCGPTSAWGDDLVNAILTEHKQNGTHGAITATSLAATGAVTGASFNTTSANGINQAALPLGSVVQVQSTNSSAVATGTTIIPGDDTIPQITEGTEFITQAITPKATTNILVIECVLFVSPANADFVIGAIFQDSTVNALSTNMVYAPNAAGNVSLSVCHTMTAGTTSATTFRVRVGGGAANTITFNGRGGSRLFGAITKSFIKITEYKA